MDYEVVIQLVGSVGFPIAACCVMFSQNAKLQETLHEMSKTMVLLTEKISDIEHKIERREIDDGK